MLVYTHPVIDRTGDITGEKGAILVPSKTILLRDDVDGVAELKVGEAIRVDKVHFITYFSSARARIILEDGTEEEWKFILCSCSDKPNQSEIREDQEIRVWKAIGVWKRDAQGRRE